MNRIKNDKILLTLCILFFIGYAVIFVSAFSELPLNVPLWHQCLLLYGHFFPMFFLELLLCRTAQVRWRILLPAVLLLLTGFWLVASAEWHAMAWFLAGWWCAAPVLGCLTAWAVWAISRHAARPAPI